MDSDPISQPTQLLHHALAPQTQKHRGPASPNTGNVVANDLSLDSNIIPVQPATPRYHLHVSPLQSPDASSERVLAEDSQKETRLKNVPLLDEVPATSLDSNVPVGRSGSDFLHLHGDSPLSASTGKVIGTKAIFFRSSPSVHPLSPPTTSMPPGNRYRPRSPPLSSQDTFGDPVLQDPAEQYLASAKQFDVPLSQLGETPTQEVVHSPTDPGMSLPDAGEHKEFLEAAIREYDRQKANRPASSRRTGILVVATPNDSDESSGAYRRDGFSCLDRDPECPGQESRFEFSGSSSFDKMLDRGLVDPPDPTTDSIHRDVAEPAPANGHADVEVPTKDDILTPPQDSCQYPPSVDWIAPAPNSTVASSNPRSLLRMVHPDNRYRIAKLRNLAGDVEPPSFITTGAAMQPSHLQETQPCLTDDSPNLDASSSARPSPHQIKVATSRLVRHHPEGEREDDEPDDALDIVPDSEPLRAGSTAQTPSHYRVVAQSPLKKTFQPLSPMSEHGSGDLVPDSLEVEGSEADIPLSVEMASRSAKRSLASAKDSIVHGRKTKTASSVVAEKAPLPVLEKQFRKPASSVKGKSTRAKSSKTEPTEVPTSLPEQDLQSEARSSMQPLAASTDGSPSTKKRGELQAMGYFAARHTSTTRLPATKSVAGMKRSHKSDTESAEDLSQQPSKDERGVRLGVQKEEEEETDHDVGSPPPPPPKTDPSRKRRRAEDVNPSYGMSKASASTRTKRSETPTITTRSGKRLRSGVSSTRGLTAEPATRVFALWKSDGHFYSGVVYSRGPKSKYVIKFDDGTEDHVELKNMRRRELVVGDRVIVVEDGTKGAVSDVSRTQSHGSFILEVDDGEEVTIREVRFGNIRIANRTIQSQWMDRTVAEGDIFTVVKPKPVIDSTPSRQSVVSTTAGKNQRELAKTGFVVTISPKNDEPIQTKDEAMLAIKQHGGLVIEDWSNVFTMEGRHSHSNRRWVATPQDFCWKSEVNLDRIFLLSDDASQKPKFLLALALGIPCISFDWLTKGEKISSDWQPYLLPAGYSDPLGARISQLVDLDWGNCTEHLTDIMASKVPIKLFAQKSVLCIGAELVPLPPSRGKRTTSDEASRYVPWIVLGMGAAKVEAVADAKQVSLDLMESFDYIIVKERDVLGSVKLRGNVVVGDVTWVKECLVSLRLSVPELT